MGVDCYCDSRWRMGYLTTQPDRRPVSRFADLKNKNPGSGPGFSMIEVKIT
jgi:hypothetical protein